MKTFLKILGTGILVTLTVFSYVLMGYLGVEVFIAMNSMVGWAVVGMLFLGLFMFALAITVMLLMGYAVWLGGKHKEEYNEM